MSAADVASMVLADVNATRESQGLVALRGWSALADLAGARAERMATKQTLSHDAAGGSVGNALDSRGIDWLGYGEVIGSTGWAWGEQAADSVVGMWMDSPVHRSLLLSDDYNYIGIGAALSSNGSTYFSAVMTESLDHTAPTAWVTGLDRGDTDVTLRWAGSDPRLQTHTAGLRDFDVRFRRDDRTWRTIRDNTQATSLTLRNRVHGHWYLFRVRARDARGTLSPWTSTTRIWVP